MYFWYDVFYNELFGSCFLLMQFTKSSGETFKMCLKCTITTAIRLKTIMVVLGSQMVKEEFYQSCEYRCSFAKHVRMYSHYVYLYTRNDIQHATSFLYDHQWGRGPRVVVSTAAFHARVRGSVPGLGGLKEKKKSSPSTCESQHCGEPPWPRGSVLGLRPLGLEFRVLCLEDSVISIISPSSGGSPGPVYMCTTVA